MFGNLDRANTGFTDADRAASDQIQAYWTRFAATGDPNGGGLAPWPRAGSGQYLAFTADGPTVKAALQPAACGVFRAWTLRRLGQ